VARGGDWIDASVARARGASTSKVTAAKERKLDLAHINPKDGVQVALDIYHEELIRYALSQLGEAWKEAAASVEEPLQICVAGGTSKVPGFETRFREVLEQTRLPFEVEGVRFAAEPLTAVASGALVAAISAERKSQGRSEPVLRSRTKLGTVVTTGGDGGQVAPGGALAPSRPAAPAEEAAPTLG
jgi:molecular chaperone DnaK (HSP70)